MLLDRDGRLHHAASDKEQRGAVRGDFLGSYWRIPELGINYCKISRWVITKWLELMRTFKGWLSNNMAPHYVRATGIGFLIAFANTSAFISTFIYLPKDKPDYTLGHSISLGALVICVLLVCTQVLFLTRENGKRARGDRDHRLTESEADRLGHCHPAYRYTI